jgi:diguanylate cyclase (GGDEF)-like protein
VEHIGFFGSSGHGVGELQLFRDADQARAAAALAGCAVVHLAAGQRLEVSNRARLYIVLRGALAIEADTSSGLADGSTSKILPGESVGEQSVLDDLASTTPVAALEDSELLLIEAELVWTLIDDVNGFARNLLRLLSFRIRAANAVLRRRQKLGEFYRQLSMNDGLTGLYNRAWLNDMLPKMVASAQRSGAPLSLIMIDLDHFKQFNDTHGHLAGDDALRAAAGVIGTALRPSDFAVRYGGEEMMVLLPDTGRAAAAMVAGRLCERMAQAVIFKDMRSPLPHVSASFGVAELEGGMDEQGLAAAADAALYRAKDGGRNRVSL